MDVTTGAGEAEARVPRDRTSAGAGAASGGSLGDALARACRALIEEQHADGHWCYELQADCTITSEYILLMHFMGELEPELQSERSDGCADESGPETRLPESRDEAHPQCGHHGADQEPLEGSQALPPPDAGSRGG